MNNFKSIVDSQLLSYWNYSKKVRNYLSKRTVYLYVAYVIYRNNIIVTYQDILKLMWSIEISLVWVKLARGNWERKIYSEVSFLPCGLTYTWFFFVWRFYRTIIAYSTNVVKPFRFLFELLRILRVINN